ncbi:MAG: hypothetical protein J6Y43_02825, partial [Clostridia bacterium]|nr:hypothetical protein [Clostridia bacterium]
EIKKIIDAADVDTCVKTCVSGLQYIHKRAENDAWYFASLFSDAETTVSVKGEFDLTATEPFTGDKIPLPAVKTDGRTQFTLRLKKETSLLVIGERVKKNKTTR